MGQGRRARVHRPALTLALGLILFGALAAVALGYHSSGFGGATNAPTGQHRGHRQCARVRALPAVKLEPREPRVQLRQARVGGART